jgi:hypothetical protein
VIVIPAPAPLSGVVFAGIHHPKTMFCLAASWMPDTSTLAAQRAGSNINPNLRAPLEQARARRFY